MDIQEAMNKAPNWATHISVGRDSKKAEFYNCVGWSQSVISSRKYVLPADIFREILDGDSSHWYFVEIKLQLENE